MVTPLSPKRVLVMTLFPSLPMFVRDDALKHTLDRLFDNTAFVWIALQQGRSIVFRFLEADVRRYRGDIARNIGLEKHRAVSRKSGVPRCSNILWSIHTNAFKSQRISIIRVGKIRQVLRGWQLWIARLYPHLPGYLIQVAVVEDHEDESRIAP